MNRILTNYVVCIFIAVFITIASQFDYKGPEAPAWVQAVGSIIAIIAAFIIPMFQHRKLERSADDAKVIENLTKLKTVHEIAIMGQTYIDIAYKGFSGDRKETEKYFAELFSELDFKDIVDTISQIPLYSVPGRSTFAALLEIRRALNAVNAITKEYSEPLFWGDVGRAAATVRIQPHKLIAMKNVQCIRNQILEMADFLSTNERRRIAFQDIALIN